MGFATRAHRSISDALIGIRKRSRVLVFGSLYLAGEALSLNGTLPD
jgi:folylpolyglutamate synthase/dihydropteroate synthase